MSIKLRLLLLIGTSVLTALIVSLVSYVGNTQMAEAVNENEVSMTAVSYTHLTLPTIYSV